MKRLIFLFVVLYSGSMIFAQEAEPVEAAKELEVSFNALLEFFLPAILGSFSMLLADAKKWIGSGQWDWSKFWETKLTPFLINVGGSVVIYLLLAVVPQAKFIIEALSGENLAAPTAYVLFAAVQGFLNGFSKSVEKEEPVE